MKDLIHNWRDILPLAGFAVLAAISMFFLFRKKEEDEIELERQRRAYLNRVGRIVEGHVVEFSIPGRITPESTTSPKVPETAPADAAPTTVNNRPAPAADGSQRLLYYSYSISGVTYETAQDISGLEERLHLSKIATGQTASVKYDPSNPSNSILIADDWSGLH